MPSKLRFAAVSLSMIASRHFFCLPRKEDNNSESAMGVRTWCYPVEIHLRS